MIDRIIDQAGGPDRNTLLGRLLDDHGAREPSGRAAQFYDEAIATKLRRETREVLGSRPAGIDDLPAPTEAVMVLASLINIFDVEPLKSHVLKLDPNITLRPKNGLPMGVRVAG